MCLILNPCLALFASYLLNVLHRTILYWGLTVYFCNCHYSFFCSELLKYLDASGFKMVKKKLVCKWFSFQMVKTVGIFIAGPFQNRTIWNLIFKKFRFWIVGFQIPSIFSLTHIQISNFCKITIQLNYLVSLPYLNKVFGPKSVVGSQSCIKVAIWLVFMLLTLN